MKKCTAVLLIAMLALAGCATMSSKGASVLHEPSANGYTIEVRSVQWVTDGWIPFKGIFNQGIQGFNVIITNESPTSIIVNWSESILAYNGNTHTPFVSGMRYLDAGRPPKDEILPAGMTMGRTVNSASEVEFIPGPFAEWSVGYAETDVMSFVLPITTPAGRKEERIDIALP